MNISTSISIRSRVSISIIISIIISSSGSVSTSINTMSIRIMYCKIQSSTPPKKQRSKTQKNTNQWDSLKHLSLVVELEIEFNIEFEPDEIAKMIDYTKIEEYINKKI